MTYYKVRGIMVDPKPEGYECPGLMVFKDLTVAREYHQACTDGTFVLREIKVLSDLRSDWKKSAYPHFATNSLRVGKLVSND